MDIHHAAGNKSRAVKVVKEQLGIDKIILQTNSLDHDRALPFYKRYGFKIFAEETKKIVYSVN